MLPVLLRCHQRFTHLHDGFLRDASILAAVKTDDRRFELSVLRQSDFLAAAELSGLSRRPYQAALALSFELCAA